MAINYPLNRDPFASGGVMDAPDVGLTAIMNKVAMGLAGQLTPQEHRRLATRQKLEEQSGAVAASKAAFQSLLGQGPIDVKSYKGSVFKGADPFSSPANAALEARFGKRAPGQIDISYGAPVGKAPSYTPAYAPTMGLLGQAQESQSDIRAAQAPTNYPTALGGKPYGLRDFGASAATPITSSFSPEAFSTTPSATATSPAAGLIGQTPPSGTPNAIAANAAPVAAPAAPAGRLAVQPQQEGYGGIMGLIESLKGIPTPSADRIGEIARNVGMLPATAANYIMGGSRRMREGVAEREDILSGARAARNQLDADQKSQLAGIDKEIQSLLPSAGQAGVSGRIDYLRRLRERTIGSKTSSPMKLPGAIGERPQMVGGTGAAQGYNLGSGPLAIDGSSSAGAANLPLSESVNADGSPGFSAEEKAQMQVREQQALRPAPMAPSASTIAAMDTLATEPDAVASGPAGALAAPETPAAPVDNRPTRIYAFGGGEPITQGLEPQARGYMAEPTGTTVSRAIAASPAARGAAVREAQFQNTLEQQAKKEREAAQKRFIGSVGDALALDPNVDISSLPKSQQSSARLQAAISRKKAGLDDKDNYAAYEKAMSETADVPAGPEKVAAIVSSYLSNKGSANPDMIKKMQDLAGAPVEVTKLPGMTVVRVGNTVRILDEKMKPFEVNRMDKEAYSKILIDSAKKYGSWDELPLELKSTLVQLDELHPKPVDPITGTIPGPDDAFAKYRKLMVGAPPAPAPRPPQAAKPGQARPATKSSVPTVNLPPGFSVKP